MTTRINELADPTTVELDTLEDWATFAAANYDEILETYGTYEKASHHLCDGGLMLGGGAAPAVHVYFVEE